MADEGVASPPVHFRAVLLPDFTGDDSDSFSQWAHCFQVCCETTGMDKSQLTPIKISRCCIQLLGQSV